MKKLREFLEYHTLKRHEVDTFLDPESPNWAEFDPELGYVLRDAFVQDGIDGAYTLAHYAPGAERRVMNYAEKPCRINCYGNSYTQCHQVGDAETWEEYLAGHLGEPIRNFGVGGYGVYTAYRRMLRVELSPQEADYVILDIFSSDDHFRSIDKFRRLRCGSWFRDYPVTMFHANPWNYCRLDPRSGELTEHSSLCPTPDSLYNLCDTDFLMSEFENDLVLNMFLGAMGEVEFKIDSMNETAEMLGLDLDLKAGPTQQQNIRALWNAYALQTTRQILLKARTFCKDHNKKLLVILSYGDNDIRALCSGYHRTDQDLVHFLKREAFVYCDLWEAHKQDYADFDCSPETYRNRYCIPHYNPTGNHFKAYQIKDTVVDWLEPKPVTYPQKGEAMRFDDYLPGN